MFLYSQNLLCKKLNQLLENVWFLMLVFDLLKLIHRQHLIEMNWIFFSFRKEPYVPNFISVNPSDNCEVDFYVAAPSELILNARVFIRGGFDHQGYWRGMLTEMTKVA